VQHRRHDRERHRSLHGRLDRRRRARAVGPLAACRHVYAVAVGAGLRLSRGTVRHQSAQPVVSVPPVFPVSIKGVVVIGERVVLLKNERAEWELPGGRLEAGESPPACVVREINEELAIDVAADELLDCWLYEVLPGREVVIVTYGCRYDGNG